jgi:hypothetical protein
MLKRFTFVMIIGVALATILSINHSRADSLTPNGALRQAAPDHGTWSPIKRVGDCERTLITHITLSTDGEGVSITYGDGITGASLVSLGGLKFSDLHAQEGEIVKLCLIKTAQCSGGSIYRATDLSSSDHQSWTLPVSERLCQR